MELHAALKSTFEEDQQLKRIARHVDQLNTQLTTSYKDLESLEIQLRKEFSDIEKMQKLSIKGLFHTVLGSKEQQIEKERQEYLQVSLKYDEAKKSVELLEYERNLLEKKLKALPAVAEKLTVLIKRREKSLIETKTPAGKKILDLLLVMDTNREFIGNVKQVETTGSQVMAILDQMIFHLKKAKSWGQWDMSGRQRGVAHMKHNAIDRARAQSYEVKHLLVRFEQDLQHVYGRQKFNLNIEFDSFSRFTDIFFDNLISDWIVQQKIQSALSNVITVKDKIIRILQTLQLETKKASEKNAKLEKQRTQLILES